MKTKLFLFCTIFLLAACGSAPTQTATLPAKPTPVSLPTRPPTSTVVPRVNFITSGTIRSNETWRGEIHLTGDITFENNAVLTIEPGTMVYVASNSDDRYSGVDCLDDYISGHNDPVGLADWDQNAILIDGRGGVINAVGTREQPITFRPEGDSTSSAQWSGIFIEKGSIQHSIILYGGRTALQVVSSAVDVEIAYNEIRFAHWEGLSDFGRNTWIHHNIVEGGGHQAMNNAMNAVVEYNIAMNAQTCHAVDGTGIVRNNLFINCARGIRIAFGDGSQVVNNTIAWVQGPPEGWYFQGNLIYPAFEVTEAISIGKPFTGLMVLNNLIYGPFQNSFVFYSVPGKGTQIDYNLLWEQRALFAGQQAAGFLGGNNLFADPLFIDPAAGDFHLTPGSPALDTGHPDILDPDGSPSDLGAYGGPQGGGWQEQTP